MITNTISEVSGLGPRLANVLLQTPTGLISSTMQHRYNAGGIFSSEQLLTANEGHRDLLCLSMRALISISSTGPTRKRPPELPLSSI